MRLLTTAAVTFGLASAAFAGGYMNNTNQSIDFVRNFAQNASTTPSGAVYWNPAGVAFADNGIYVSAHTQTILQGREIKAEGFGKYEGEAFVPTMPSITAAYKATNWAVFGSFFISGGGGSVEFDDGVPLLDALVSGNTQKQLAAQMGDKGVAALSAKDISLTDLYDVETYFKGSSTIYAWLVGGSYKVTDILSLSIGVRLNYAVNEYKVSYELSPTETATGVDKMMGTQLSKALDQEETLLNVKQSGLGFTPVFGAHLHFEKVDFGFKYEAETNIETENDTKKIADVVSSLMPQYLDGFKDDYDMPAQISIGGRVKATDWLRIAAGYNHYFDKDAEYAGDMEHSFHHDEKEFVFGAEVDPIKALTLSAGVMRTQFGLDDDMESDLDFCLNSTSVGGGFAVRLTDWVALQVGYMETIYDTFRKIDKITGTKRSYDRTSHNIGGGIDFKF